MKQDDINKLTDLTNLHIRLSEAINICDNKKPLLDIQKKVADEMQKIVNPLVECRSCGLPNIDPSKIQVVDISKENKPARRRSRGLGIR